MTAYDIYSATSLAVAGGYPLRLPSLINRTWYQPPECSEFVPCFKFDTHFSKEPAEGRGYQQYLIPFQFYLRKNWIMDWEGLLQEFSSKIMKWQLSSSCFEQECGNTFFAVLSGFNFLF
ncbi:expressed unknown protein [Seminavis robusta]|uniref:Uncharacterized protein n=1 Tax=Seminavis robusta TaxID=568900 RepID=A0A9N8ESB6_9STRA|nr:expressed unknown protein [Seminavis robusta]|eukprot:Sro1507_g278351.1  (119) ;mRNA; r:14616-14972